jgi:polygalacturonase
MCSMIAGIPGYKIENVKLSNILFQHSGGGTKIDAARQLEEAEKGYPEPTMFGNTPAHGFFIRHAKDIEINQCKILCSNKDARPCFVLDDVEQIDFCNIKADQAGATPLFILKDAKNVRVEKCNSLPDTEVAAATHKEL